MVSPKKLNIRSLALLAKLISQYEAKFIEEKEMDMEKHLKSENMDFQSELEGRMKTKMTKEH